MRLAIPSDDGITIAQHTGRARGFVVYEISGNTCRKIAYRTITETTERDPDNACGQVPGGCTPTSGGAAEHHDHRNHDSILELVGDCNVIVACGAGRRLVNDFVGKGIRLMFCREQSVEEVARLFAEGKLEIQSEGSCNHLRH